MRGWQYSIPMDTERRYCYKQPCLQKDNASGGWEFVYTEQDEGAGFVLHAE